MSLSAKKHFLMSRYGYSEADLQEYATDHRCQLPIAIDRLFYYHIDLNKRQNKLFEDCDTDSKASQEIDGRLF